MRLGMMKTTAGRKFVAVAVEDGAHAWVFKWMDNSRRWTKLQKVPLALVAKPDPADLTKGMGKRAAQSMPLSFKAGE